MSSNSIPPFASTSASDFAASDRTASTICWSGSSEDRFVFVALRVAPDRHDEEVRQPIGLSDQIVHPLRKHDLERTAKENRKRVAMKLLRTRTIVRGTNDATDSQIDGSRIEVDAIRSPDQLERRFIGQGGKDVIGHPSN